MYDFEPIRRHFCDQIFNATVMPDPFPLMVIDNVLPEFFSADLLASIPPRSYFDTYLPDTLREHENTFRLYPDKFGEYSQHNAEIIGVIARAFPEISRLIAAKLSPFFPALFEGIFPDDWKHRISNVNVHHSLSLTFLDRALHCHQSPHTDASYRIGTWLYYLPLDVVGGAGTDIYRVVRHHPDYKPLETYFSAKPLNVDIEFVKEVEFIPNRVIAFLNSPTSFHGYRSHTNRETQPERRITFNNWIQYDSESYRKIFADTPKEYFDLHYDQIWHP